MDLKTTTRPGRNANKFRELRRLLNPQPGKTISVLEAGPGLAVRYLGRAGSLFYLLERLVRRLPLPDLFFESYETDDLLSAFEGVDLRLTLLDINPRPLKVIASQERRAAIQTVVVDLAEPSPSVLTPLLGSFDAVVAMHLVGRIPDVDGRRNAEKNLCALAKSGGLILANQADLLSLNWVREVGLSDVYRNATSISR